MKQTAAFLFAPADVTREGDKVTGFGGVAYSGGVVPNYGWRGDMAIDLSGMQLPPGRVPITFGHNDDSVDEIIGHAGVVNDGTSLRLTDGKFSDVTEAGRKASALMAEGQPFMFSVGVNGRSHETTRDTPTPLNGRDLHVDTVMRNARLLHVSFVNAGADPNAHAARLSASMGHQPDEEQSNMDKDARIAELEGQVATLTAGNATLTADLAARTTERDAAQGELTTIRANARNAAIERLFGADHGLTDAQLTAYRGMDDAQFAAVDAALSTARQGNDPALFRPAATQGRDPGAAAGVVAEFKAPAGYAVDTQSATLYAKARQYQAEHPNTEFLAAVTAVSTGA